MDIVGLLKSALQALTAYLELRTRGFYYDIIKSSQDYQKQLIDEIEKLRNSNTSSGNDRADILRAELIRERKTLEHLSTVYTSSREK
jgi:hypothetical protein